MSQKSVFPVKNNLENGESLHLLDQIEEITLKNQFYENFLTNSLVPYIDLTNNIIFDHNMSQFQHQIGKKYNEYDNLISKMSF